VVDFTVTQAWIKGVAPSTNHERGQTGAPIGSRAALSDITVQSAREGVEGGKRRRKQCPQGAMTTADCDDNINGQAGGFGIGSVMTAAHSDKR
jgi:hypothetical protein